MPDEKVIIGVVKSLPKRTSYDRKDSGDSGFGRCVDLIVLDFESRIVPVRFVFPSMPMAEGFLESLSEGLLVRIPVVNHGEREPYEYALGHLSILSDADLLTPFGLGNTGPRVPPSSFSSTEQRSLQAALQCAKDQIRNQFHPTQEQMRTVEGRLDQLSMRVVDLAKLDWAKLFIGCVVGISIDLGFGTTVPQTLLNLFKSLIAGILTHKMLEQSSVESL